MFFVALSVFSYDKSLYILTTCKIPRNCPPTLPHFDDLKINHFTLQRTMLHYPQVVCLT